MKRNAFSIIEMIVVVGVIGAVTALSIPLYREYQIRSDLDNAAQQSTQGLARAKLLSQLGEQDATWGFYVPSGTLYKGVSYESRDQQFDEVYPMPSTIAVSGLLDVSYSRVEGAPSEEGDIVLRALNNDQRLIQVTIAVNTQAIAANEGDVLTICHSGNTLQIPDVAWPGHQAHGDTLNACAGAASSAAASSVQSSAGAASSAAVSSAAASSQASSAIASSAAGGGGGPGNHASACTSKFTIAANGTLTTTSATSVTFTNLLSQITFGAGGPTVPVHACYSVNNGSSFNSLFGGNGNCSGNGNAYGNAVKPAGTDTKTVNIATNKQVAVKIQGRYKQNGWLAFNESFVSNDGSEHVHVLLNGDQLANYPGFGSQTSLKNSLVSRGKANASGQITIGNCEALIVAELGNLNTSASDFQDDVMLVTFN